MFTKTSCGEHPKFLVIGHVHRGKKFGLPEGHVVFEEAETTTRSYVWEINFISFGCFFLLNCNMQKRSELSTY